MFPLFVFYVDQCQRESQYFTFFSVMLKKNKPWMVQKVWKLFTVSVVQ